MAEDEKRTDGELLYDPLFEKAPDTVIRDTPGRGFFGKAAVKKAVFILALVLIVGLTVALSVNSLSKDRFRYEETDGGWMLVEFNAAKTDAVLMADAVYGEDGAVQPGKTLTAIRTFAVCGNEYTSFIFVGKDVRELPNTAFYNCTSLMAVLVDSENPNYYSDDGVLYRTENGSPAEIMLYPAKNAWYRALLALGDACPADAAEARAFAERAAALEAKSANWFEKQKKSPYPDPGLYGLSQTEADALTAAFAYEILPGVTKVGEMAFAECGALFSVTIPEGVTAIDTMAFFKCVNLRGFRIPDSAETIGSDAFSYCAKVPYIFIPASVKEIGHHAFWGCDAVAESDAVYLACSEENAPVTGQDWLPKYRTLFLHDAPVIYDAERRAD